MVRLLLVALIGAGMIPLSLAWHHKRNTSLAHALLWTIVAWLSWGVAFVFTDPESANLEPGRYCALCLTGCAGVAVFGARRPHVAAWNFVVVGLFAVLAWPLVETLLIGTHPVDGLRISFMAATLAVGILNYVPTRLAPAAIATLVVSAGEIVLLYVPAAWPGQGDVMWLDLLLTAIPWIAWFCLRRNDDGRTEFTRLWISFRDSWGFVWSQRVREQFNRVAENAGWPIRLTWQGLVQEKNTPAALPADVEKSVAILRATLQRFLASEQRG